MTFADKGNRHAWPDFFLERSRKLDMSNLFRIKLTGRILPGHTRDSTAISLSSLMGINLERALGLLTGREEIVKHNLTGEKVPRYVMALEKSGAEVRVERMDASDDDDPPSPWMTSTSTLPVLDFPTLIMSEVEEAPPATASMAPKVKTWPSTPPPEPRAPTETMHCPACGTRQAKRNLCTACGIDMSRLSATENKNNRTLAPAFKSAYMPPRADVRDAVERPSYSATPHPLALSTQGRIGRLRYMAYSIPAYLPLAATSLIGLILTAIIDSKAILILFIGIGWLVTSILGIRILILRLHDLNRSGWWILAGILAGVAGVTSGAPWLLIIPGAGSLALLFWPGKHASNDYGPPSGENTIWTIVGAVTMVGLTLIGSTISPAKKFIGPGGLPDVRLSQLSNKSQ
jgi:uncharacterized membrane protein YhaH (DUF805 family)